MIVIDDKANHFMQSHIRDDGYVVLAWPKNLTVAELEWARETVNLQLDSFLRSARKETEREEAARLEYESWKATAAQPAGGDGS